MSSFLSFYLGHNTNDTDYDRLRTLIVSLMKQEQHRVGSSVAKSLKEAQRLSDDVDAMDYFMAEGNLLLVFPAINRMDDDTFDESMPVSDDAKKIKRTEDILRSLAVKHANKLERQAEKKRSEVQRGEQEHALLRTFLKHHN